MASLASRSSYDRKRSRDRLFNDSRVNVPDFSGKGAPEGQFGSSRVQRYVQIRRDTDRAMTSVLRENRLLGADQDAIRVAQCAKPVLEHIPFERDPPARIGGRHPQPTPIAKQREIVVRALRKRDEGAWLRACVQPVQHVGVECVPPVCRLHAEARRAPNTANEQVVMRQRLRVIPRLVDRSGSERAAKERPNSGSTRESTICTRCCRRPHARGADAGHYTPESERWKKQPDPIVG